MKYSSVEICRNRKLALIFILITMIIGLGSRKYPQFFPAFLAEYLGDTLWAMLVFWLTGLVFAYKSILKVGCTALLFSYLIEISQLYQAPWINSIRNTTLGSLVLGHGFLWSDILCYTVGIAIGIVIEILIYYRNQHK